MTQHLPIKVTSSNREVFTIKYEVARLSGLITTVLQDLHYGEEEYDGQQPIPLPTINSAILIKVIAWCEYHKNDNTQAHRPSRELSAWDAEFMEIDHNTLFELFSAASYLEIKNLEDLTCRSIGNMMRGKTADEILAGLGVGAE
ncbi:unnamed protein product, partial [Mesorhabditis spiculigera]